MLSQWISFRSRLLMIFSNKVQQQLSCLESKRLAVRILEGKLHSIVVEVISIPEIHAPAKLELAACHHILHRVEQKVS